MKKYIIQFIKEIIPIIMGILIALYINDWSENRKDKKYLNQISISINEELNETRKDISDVIPTQKSFVDTLNVYLKNDKISLLDIVIKSNGVRLPVIKTNSWKAVSNSKIELMNYKKVSILANIEEEKEILRMKTEKIMNLIYSNTSETGKDKKELMKLLILDIMNTEKSIQKEVEKVLNE